MSTKSFLIIVALVGVLSQMISGCSQISYAAAPTDTPIASLPTEISQPIPPSTAQLPTQENVDDSKATLDELVGIWFKGDYIEFKSNGTYAVYTSLEAFQADVRIDEGNFGVQGNQVWLGPMSRNCNGMGFYQLTNTNQNELELTKIREECSRSLGKLQRVSP